MSGESKEDVDTISRDPTHEKTVQELADAMQSVGGIREFIKNRSNMLNDDENIVRERKFNF